MSSQRPAAGSSGSQCSASTWTTSMRTSPVHQEQSRDCWTFWQATRSLWTSCVATSIARVAGVNPMSVSHSVVSGPDPRSKLCVVMLSFFPPPGWGERSAGAGLASNWSERTLDAFENLGFIIASDWSEEPVTCEGSSAAPAASVSSAAPAASVSCLFCLPLTCLGLLLLRAARGAVRAPPRARLVVGAPHGLDDAGWQAPIPAGLPAHCGGQPLQ